jgi:putative Holliday junction resolvase
VLSEFLSGILAEARLLGIDLGTKRIGLAISDAGRSLAAPLKTIPRAKFTADAATIQALMSEHRAGGIVLGLPLNMDGSSGPRAQSTKAYGVNLARALNVPVLLWDERLSSFEAGETMREAGASRAKREANIDAAAAALILQDMLDVMARNAAS